jgi:hypothetical protein
MFALVPITAASSVANVPFISAMRALPRPADCAVDSLIQTSWSHPFESALSIYSSRIHESLRCVTSNGNTYEASRSHPSKADFGHHGRVAQTFLRK